MKKILLISNRVMHYRSRIYNSFFYFFQTLGYEFHVISNEYQKVDFSIEYFLHEKPFSVKGYCKFINELQPDVCINFLHLKDKLIIPLTLYCKVHKIPMIYWNHGINLKTPDAKIKNIIFHLIHTISSAILLYSQNQLKYISRKNQKKTFIARNTLNFSQVDKSLLRAKEDIKSSYGIKQKIILLYVSRILPYKGLDVLLKNFKDTTDIALVIVGGGLSKEQKSVIDSVSHYYYLGEKYGTDVDEIYSIGDIFSTPGHIGLALNQAMFWSLPVVVLNRIHAPEIIALKNGYNGWIAKDDIELKEKILELSQDNSLLEKMSANARFTYENEMQLSNMFKGFVDAIQYVEKK